MSTWFERNPLAVFSGMLSFFAGVFFVSFFAASVGAPAPTIPPQLPLSEYTQRMLDLDKEALDGAYRDQVMHLFSTWMKDDAGQPSRALVGVRKAQRAYVDSMKAIKEREEELKTR